jgi:hypothetical protein
MGKGVQFWWGMILGLILGISLLLFVAGFWVWGHHMFVFGISNRSALFVGLGLIGAVTLLGVTIGRLSKRNEKDRLDR